MVLHEAFLPERVPSLVAGLALLALALVLLWLDLGKPAHRAFALLLVLRAMFIALLAFSTTFVDLGGRYRAYFAIATPFAALWFASVYESRFEGPPGSPARARVPIAGVALLLAALIFEALYVWDHDLFAAPGPPGRVGPLTLFVPLAYAAFAFVALFLGSKALELPPGSKRSALLLPALGFALEPVHQATFNLLATSASLGLGELRYADLAARPVELAERVIWLVPLGLVIWLLARVSPVARSDPDERARSEARRFLALLAFPLASGVAITGVYVWERLAEERFFLSVHFAVDAFWTLLAPLFVAWAIVRHRFLDVEVRLKWTIKQGTLVAFGVVFFFVLSETLQEVLSPTAGPFLAILITAGVLFALHPLQRFAEKVSEAALPNARPIGEMHRKERLALYRSQTEIAWMDGELRPKERLFLERLRERLGITHEEAARIETDLDGAEGAETALGRKDAKPSLRPPGRRSEG